ncbi:hypothetical protein ACGK9R_05305 [Halomonas sp. HNIBRBA4712]|uniref:hypothetical protein n=1 Tax=Halomonas sp. HNIBRBA4712 TaxID=3373087 RepID=UPI003745B151
MRKWIMLAVFNWLRKPANRQKVKNAWDKHRGKTPNRTQPPPNAGPHGASRRPGDLNDRY